MPSRVPRLVRRSHLLAALAVAIGGAMPAGAQTLSGDLTVDNVFTAYLSTSASSTAGATLLSSGANWASTYSFGPTALTPGTTYYLLIQAVDQGAPGAFVGDFTLSGTGFQFANGLQTLTTNTTDWSASRVGFGGAAVGIMDRGADGVGPWGDRAGIDNAARNIWEAGDCGNCTVYFSTTIAATTSSVVPEPGTYVLFSSGLVGLAIAARLRRQRA